MTSPFDEDEDEDLSNNNCDEIQIVYVYSEAKEQRMTTRAMRRITNHERIRSNTTKEEKHRKKKPETLAKT